MCNSKAKPFLACRIEAQIYTEMGRDLVMVEHFEIVHPTYSGDLAMVKAPGATYWVTSLRR